MIAQSLVERIIKAATDGSKFKVAFQIFYSACSIHSSFQVFVVIPELPGFAGDVKSQSALKTIMAAQYRTMNRAGNSIYEQIRKAGYEP